MSGKIILGNEKTGGKFWGLADRFTKFHARYTAHFQGKTRSVFEAAAFYIKGLMQGEPGKRNMERMAEVIPDSNDQALQHMISDSPWSADAVRDQGALDADRLSERLGGATSKCGKAAIGHRG